MIKILCIAGMAFFPQFNEAVNLEQITSIQFEGDEAVIRVTKHGGLANVYVEQDRNFTETDIRSFIVRLQSCKEEQ